MKMRLLFMVISILTGCGAALILAAFQVNKYVCSIFSGVIGGLVMFLLQRLFL